MEGGERTSLQSCWHASHSCTQQRIQFQTLVRTLTVAARQPLLHTREDYKSHSCTQERITTPPDEASSSTQAACGTGEYLAWLSSSTQDALRYRLCSPCF